MAEYTNHPSAARHVLRLQLRPPGLGNIHLPGGATFVRWVGLRPPGGATSARRGYVRPPGGATSVRRQLCPLGGATSAGRGYIRRAGVPSAGRGLHPGRRAYICWARATSTRRELHLGGGTTSGGQKQLLLHIAVLFAPPYHVLFFFTCLFMHAKTVSL